MKTAKFSKLERTVGHIASRRAHGQLMRVPWDRFHKAYEEYINWQAFTLWAASVVETEGNVPSWFKPLLRKRCPGFMEEVYRSNKPKLLGLQLQSWIHNEAFGFAKEERWLDALAFYGFRDTRAQGYWAYWEHCESEWKKGLRASVPNFAEWKRLALNWKFHGDVSYAVVAKAVEKFIDFEALAYCLRPLFRQAKVQLSLQVAFELSQESPSLLEFVKRETSDACETKLKSWKRLFNFGRDTILASAKQEGWTDCVLRQVRIHPLHLRIVDYAALCDKSGLENTALPSTSLSQWQRDAEGYVTARRK